jgi:hypothetical protein
VTTLTTAKLKKAIASTYGNVWRMASELDVERSTIYRRIEQSEELQEALKEAREVLTDIAESELAKRIIAGEMPAIALHLKASREGRNRGYGERTEMTGADGGPITIKGYATVNPDDWQGDDGAI